MRHVKICASLVMLVLVAGPAFAQQPLGHEQHHPPAAAVPGMPGGMMPGDGGMPMMTMMRMMMGEDGMSGMPMMAAIDGHVEGRTRPAYLTAAAARLQRDVAAFLAAEPARIAADIVEGLRKLNAAVDPLYAALSDEQKQTADELIMGPMGMM